MKVFVEDQLLTDSGYRDSYAWEDALRVPGVSEDALETLVKRRILRKEEHFGALRVELTHDLLTRVIRESRDVRQAREAQVRAEEAARLAERRILAEQRARRKWTIAFAATTLLMLGALFFGRRSLDAGRAADAKSRLVFSQQPMERARQLFESRPDLAWLVAEEAYRHPKTQDNPGALNQGAKRLLFDSELLIAPNLNRYFERDVGELTRFDAGEVTGFYDLALSPNEQVTKHDVGTRGVVGARSHSGSAGRAGARAPAPGPPGGGSLLCDDSASRGSTRPEARRAPVSSPADTAGASPRHTRVVLAPSRGPLSGGVGNTGFEATPCLSVTLLLRVIAGLTCPARFDRIVARCHGSFAL